MVAPIISVRFHALMLLHHFHRFSPLLLIFFQKKQTKKIFDEKCLRIFLRCDFTVFSTKLNFVILLIKSTLTEIENPSEDQVFFTTFEGQVSGMIF